MALIDNLISYWKLDDTDNTNAVDAQGDNNGTQEGGITDEAAGKIGTAFEFDGGDPGGYVSVPDDVDFSFTTGSNDLPFSFAAWIRPDVVNEWRGIMCKYFDTSPFDGEWQFMITDQGELYGQCLDGNTSTRITITSSFTFSTGTWYHIAFTYDGSGSQNGMNVYQNGVIDAGPTRSMQGSYSNMDNLTAPVDIGAGIRDSGFDNYWDGRIDEVGIWNKELTPTEADDLWNDGNGLAYPFAAPEGTNMQIQIGGAWKDVPAMQLQIGGAWKDVEGAQMVIDDGGKTWKTIF